MKIGQRYLVHVGGGHTDTQDIKFQGSTVTRGQKDTNNSVRNFRVEHVSTVISYR